VDRALLLALPSVDGWPGAAWLSPRMPRISRIAWAMRFPRDVPVPVLWTGCGFYRPCRHRGADPGAAFHISSTARAAGLSGQSRWPSSVARATGSAQGLVSTFSRGRATASIERPSERPALAVLLLRVLPFSSGRSRLNDWRRSDRRLQPNSGFQRWRTACGRGPVIPIRDGGAPGEASSFPRHAAAVPFLGTPSRAGRRPRGPLPYRPPSCFQAPHTFRRALRELRSPISPGGAQGCLQVHRATCDSWSTPAGSTRAGRIRILPTPDAALAPAVIVACVPGWDGPRGQRDDRDLPRHTVPGTVLWLRSGAFDRHRSAGHPARRPPLRASSSRRTVPFRPPRSPPLQATPRSARPPSGGVVTPLSCGRDTSPASTTGNPGLRASPAAVPPLLGGPMLPPPALTTG